MKPSVLISVALVLGGIAAFGVSRWAGIGGSKASGPPVVIATAAIEPGAIITKSQVRLFAWPSAAVPPGSSSDPAKLEGRVARQVIYPGEPVLESKLAALDSKGGLASTISPGKRAITVRVNDVIAVAGFTLPGSFVDVLANVKDSANEPFSKIVLSRVKVLAIAQETASDQTKPRVVNAVTLELTPEESERLDLARSIGSLSLVLRNELDTAPVTSSGSRRGDVVGVQRASVSSVAAPPSVSAAVPQSGIEEIRGTKRKESQ